MLPVQTVRIRTGEGDSTYWLSQADVQDRSVPRIQLNMGAACIPEEHGAPSQTTPSYSSSRCRDNGASMEPGTTNQRRCRRQDPMSAADVPRMHSARPRGRRLVPGALFAVAALTGLAGCGAGAPPSPSPSTSSSPSTAAAEAGKPGHVFVINLENKSYRDVWNDQSAAPYLSQTLKPQGVLLTRYYADRALLASQLHGPDLGAGPQLR